MYTASDLRKGLKIEIDGQPWEVVDFQFVKPGKGQALYRTRIRNYITGASVERTFRSVDKIDKPNLREHEYTYSYEDGMNFVFMDKESFEQIEVPADLVGINKYFLIEDMDVSILFHNDKPLGITLPNFVEKEILETEPGARGDTATNVTKPAKINGGYEIQVPIFVNEGDIVRIDTRNGKYADRVAKG